MKGDFLLRCQSDTFALIMMLITNFSSHCPGILVRQELDCSPHIIEILLGNAGKNIQSCA
jgi:hypothetical protein